MMKHDIDPTPTAMREPLPATRQEQQAGGEAVRRAYAPPHLERLGAWSALTLQQSIPIFP